MTEPMQRSGPAGIEPDLGEGPVKVLTFGCRLNAHESQVMHDQALHAGLEALPGGAVLVNTCAVTGEAVRQARQAIRKARRDHPSARIIVTGCAAQTEPETFGAMDEVDLVVGNDDKLHAHAYRALPDFGVNDAEKVRVNDIMEVREIAPHLLTGFGGRTRAFVQVQNGCDHRCTFCIIPYGRGNSRSVPAGAVVDQVRELVDAGHLEVVLTGVDMTSWGGDLPGGPKLGRLVQAVLAGVPDLKRLRLSSIDSIEADEALIEAAASETRFMPHLHLSLQHGDDLILKRMKRRHSRDDAIRFCQDLRARRPDMVFGADLMAGFPTETETMFANTLSLIEACGLTFGHVFPFSPRPGTPAARMPQLARQTVRERAARLREASARALVRHLDGMVGIETEILVEDGRSGLTPDYVRVRLAETTGEGLLAVKITGHDGATCRAVPLQTGDRLEPQPAELAHG